MKFTPPEATLAYWKKKDKPLVQNQEIDLLEKHVKLKAPDSYREFLTHYGAVEFDFDINDQFTYRYTSEVQTEVRRQSISFIKKPERAIQYYDGLQKDPKLELPVFLIPFGMDYGQGELLIEFGQETEKIYYWDFDTHDWESGKTRIAIVADNFYQFINSLAPYDEPENHPT